MELLVSWKCVGVKFVISCRKKTPNWTNCLKLSKIFSLRNYSFIGKDPCLASIDGISRLSVLRCEICFFSRWWEICNRDISASFWLGKKTPSTKIWAKNGKAPSSQWSLVLKRAQAKHLKLLARRRLSTLLECKSLFYFIFRFFFFYSNIIWFLTVKVSAFPHTWKADYSFSCSYLLFIPFWYYPRGAEGISQPALEPCGTPVVSPNSWDGSRQLIMILNYIYSNLDSFFLVSWFALELGMGIRILL